MSKLFTKFYQPVTPIPGVYNSPTLEIIGRGAVPADKVAEITTAIRRYYGITPEIIEYTCYVKQNEPLHHAYGKTLIRHMPDIQKVWRTSIMEKDWKQRLLLHVSIREDGDMLISQLAKTSLKGQPYFKNVNKALSEVLEIVKNVVTSPENPVIITGRGDVEEQSGSAH